MPNRRADVADVQHNPTRRDRTVKSGDRDFFCLIRRSGILVRVDMMRAGLRDTQFVCATDLATLMGFPVLPQHATAAGAPSLFTRGIRAPDTRDGGRKRAQLGNAMHVAHIGSVCLVALAQLPMLGLGDPSRAAPPRPLWPHLQPLLAARRWPQLRPTSPAAAASTTVTNDTDGQEGDPQFAYSFTRCVRARRAR